MRDRTGQAGPWPGRTSRPLACGKGGGLHPGQAAFLRAARAGGCTPGKPPSCVPQGRGGCTPDKPPSCVPQGREVEYFRLAEIRGHEGKAHMSTRLAAGRSCPFSGLVAGEASPAPPGRGLCPLPSPLRGALPPRPPNGGKFPPYPPLKGRVRGRTGQAGPRPGRTSRPVAGQDRPPSCLRQGQGGCTPGKPPSCVPQGRGVAPQASRLLACRKGGRLNTFARPKYANVRP